MKRVLFKKIVVTYLATTALLFLPLEYYLSRSVKEQYISNLEKNLQVQAVLISEELPEAPQNLDDFSRRFKEKTGARITVIDEGGLVLGDSDESSSRMENHAGRPEIRDADMAGSGASIRYSKTLDKNFFYLAVAVERNGGKRFLRLSMPLDAVETAMNAMRIRILLSSLAALSAAILIGFLLTRRMTRSIEEIGDFSRAVASGDLNKRLIPTEKNELGEIGKNISDMAQGLSAVLRQTSAENARMKAILENMSDGLVVTDTKGNILLSNAAVKTIFGITSDIEGRKLTEALRSTEVAVMMDAAVRDGERISREIAISRPADIYLVATASPYYSSVPHKEVSGAVMTFHDITRLRRLEEIRKDFVANVSHEIKTPITAIKGFAETLLDGAIDEKENARKFLITIRNHSERLNSLVSDLLTLSSIELGDISLKKGPVRLDEIIEVVFMTLGEKARDKSLYLKKEIVPASAEVLADRDRLIQVLLNLVENGIKFTERGGVTVTVQTVEGKQGVETIEDAAVPAPNRILITVEDTGAGIPKKHLTRLGERFYRVDHARSRELGGTGLGLAIVKHIVKIHGWDMKIESEEIKGTRVTILCPAIN